MKAVFSFLFLFFCVFVSAQNLVLNPGFEEGDMPGFTSSIDMGLLTHWFQPTEGTSDWFYRKNSAPPKGKIRDAEQDRMQDFGGETMPDSGSYFAGAIEFTSSMDTYREYMTGEISRRLVKGKSYSFSFSLQLGNDCGFSIPELQIYFSEQLPTHQNIRTPLEFTPQLSIVIDRANSQKGKWVKISGIYKATGGELFFTVGNFKNDNDTKAEKVKSIKKISNNYAYYYFDNFFIGLIGQDTAAINSDSISFYNPNVSNDTIWSLEAEKDTLGIAPGKKLVAQNIYFELDKSILKEESFPILDEIILVMKGRPDLKVEIDGYTDSQGDTEHNLKLSSDRAKAVANYFISKGISANRITTRGFGSGQPLADESIEEGRAKNRRVEFIFSE